MIDPFCIGLLTLWLAQADALAPEAPAREPQPSTDAAGRRTDDPAPPGRRPRERRIDPALLRALAAARGNRSRAAELLGISRKSLWERLARWQGEAGMGSEPPENDAADRGPDES